LTKRASGFSLIELLVAMAVMVTVSGALMSLILAGGSTEGPARPLHIGIVLGNARPR
jgi:prepilin-type N-terminal cleavage/methylation domain-containing protein